MTEIQKAINDKAKKLPTMKLKGKDYVAVKDRVLFFNEEYSNGSITTEMQSMEGGVCVKAIVYPDISNKERYFTGRSFGKLQNEKALEKLETVAVGRALAFMGIGVVESIASADEIKEYNESTKTASYHHGY
jgi:hypothetical protein